MGGKSERLSLLRCHLSKDRQCGEVPSLGCLEDVLNHRRASPKLPANNTLAFFEIREGSLCVWSE